MLWSERAIEVLSKVDRAEFCPEEPYYDTPVPIGYNATISAPHMHAFALETSMHKLKEGARVLDVGSGSGYLAVCFAHLVKPSGKVIGIDHVEGLVELSLRNTRKSNSALLDEGILQLVCGDGRQGWPAAAPYDVIHVGASGPEIPAALLEQLAPGGILMMPVGSEYTQNIRIVTKNEMGEVSSERDHVPVRYVPLTSKDLQLK